MLPLLQIALLTIIALYLVRWRQSTRRKSDQSWDSLIARLRSDSSARDLSEHYLWREGVNVTPEETWTRIRGAHGLWAMYQNAKVMLEMADYAQCHCESVDRELLATLRSDAMQIRVCVLMALVQYACTQASEGVRVNAFRAASMYTGMAARMTQLLQQNAAIMVPNFVAAM
jgi:hypothetical protein